MNGATALLLGIVLAGAGGQLFVRGAVGLALGLRIAPVIVGVTVAAVATSSPELVIGISSALAGAPQVSFGNILGANVLDLTLVLGIALLFGPLRERRQTLLRDIPTAFAVPLLLAAVGWDGTVSRLDGALLVAAFGGWLVPVLREALRERHTQPAPVLPKPIARPLLYAGIGLALLVLAGHFVVSGAHAIGAAWGLSTFLVGATLVALGTTIPELATAVAARLNGHDDIGLSELLGSTIFNGLFIVGVTALIHPVVISGTTHWAALGFGVLAVLLTIPLSDGMLGRRRALLLIAVYAAYVLLVLNH